MFTISSPEKPWLGTSEVTTLREALKRKYAWQTNQKGCHAIITNASGYVVTTREQEEYLAAWL